MKQLTEQEFGELKFEPNHLNPSRGDMFETYGEDIEYVISMIEKKRVVTFTAGGDYVSYMTGYHLVNRMGYYILETPYEEEFFYEEDDEEEEER